MKRDNTASFLHTEIVVDFVSHTLQEYVFEVACDISPFDHCRMRVLTLKIKSFIFLNKNYCRYIYIFFVNIAILSLKYDYGVK